MLALLEVLSVLSLFLKVPTGRPARHKRIMRRGGGWGGGARAACFICGVLAAAAREVE